MTNNFRDDVYEIPTINLVDGVPSDDTIQDILYVTESAFNKISNAIGNIHGRGDHLSDGTKFISNIASAIGNASKDVAIPNGVQFSNYKQIFVPNSKKYFNLDIVPGSNIAIGDGVHPSTYWVRKNSYGQLSSAGDYVVDGIKLVFYKEPDTQFDVTYDGVYFDIGYSEGYLPNVLPSQSLRSQNKISKPTLSTSSNGRYKLTVPLANGSVLGELQDDFDYSLAPYLQQYASANGAIECPQAYMGIWIKDGQTFYRLDTNNVYIISPNEFEFTTAEDISASDEFAVYLANRSMAEDIEVIFKNLFKHSHNGQDGSAVIDHSSLSGLIPKTDNVAINYGGSIVPGNDHPQYFHREGYRSDPGSYNNAILGDVLIGSTSELSQFNNIDADSNKLIFGSISNGHALKRRFAHGDLLLFSGFNGLSIDFDNTQEESYGLAIKDNKFGTDVDTGNLVLETGSGVFELRTLDGAGRQSVKAGEVISRSAQIEESISVAEYGELNIGPFSFANVLTDLIVSMPGIENKIKFHPMVQFDEAYIDNATVDTLLIEEGKRILFGTNPGSLNNSYMTTVNDTVAAFHSYESFKFINSGKNTGLGLTSANALVEYTNLYTSAEGGGASTNSDHNTYLETGDGGTYFLKGTRDNKTLDGKIYAWKETATDKVRVDSLRAWPRSDIYAQDGSFDQVNINQSNLQDKKGLRFGTLNGIYVTGDSAPCPPGIMVVESQNGVVIASSTTSADACGSLEHAPLTSGIFQAFGGISTDESITALGDVTVGRKISSDQLTVNTSTTINGNLRVDAASRFDREVFFNSDSKFNANLEVNSNLKVNNTISAQSVNVIGTSILNGIVHVNSDAFIGGSLQASSITASGNTILNANLRVGGDASFDGKVTYSGDTTFNANLNIRGSVDVNGTVETTSLKVTSVGIFDSVTEFNGNATFGSTLLANDLTITGDATIGNSDSNTVINGNLSVNTELFRIGGPLEVFGVTSIKDKLITTSTVEIGGGMSVFGSAEFNSALNVNSNINAFGGNFSQSIKTDQDINATGSISGGSLNISRTANVSGILSANSIVVEESINASASSESNLGSLRIAGSFEQSSSTEIFTVSGDADFRSELNVQGNLNVNSTLNIGNEASGVNILTNNIIVNGQNGIIEVENLNASKISGNNTNIPVPNVILQYAPALIQVISGRPFVAFESGVYFQDKALFSNAAIFTDIIYATQIEFLGNPDNAINIVAKKARYAD